MEKPDFEKMAAMYLWNGGKAPRSALLLAQAAYDAGLERAAEIADAYEGSSSVERADSPSTAAACGISDAIRAEKSK